jgi:hypothetical protein
VSYGLLFNDLGEEVLVVEELQRAFARWVEVGDRGLAGDDVFHWGRVEREAISAVLPRCHQDSR